jgi:acyl carrier protein
MSTEGGPATEPLKLTLKKNLIEWLSLEDVTVEQISDQDGLFGEGLGLDSLDAVELVVMLHRVFGIPPNELVEKKQVFSSIETLAAYVHVHRKK